MLIGRFEIVMESRRNCIKEENSWFDFFALFYIRRRLFGIKLTSLLYILGKFPFFHDLEVSGYFDTVSSVRQSLEKNLFLNLGWNLLFYRTDDAAADH